MSNTRIIARNTGWYGFENAISFVVSMVSSIAIARTLGPSKMGYLVYLTWIAQIVGGISGVGVAAATRKYMAEFLGKGDRGTARYIYVRTIVLQAAIATAATGGILAWVLWSAQAEYRTASILIALGIWPSMVNSISAQANVAREEMSANMAGSVVSAFVFAFGIGATVVFKWGVLGVGASMLGMRASDFIVRVFPTHRTISAWEKKDVLEAGLPRRMLSFAWKSVATMVVNLIVWERSEIFLLRTFCFDIRQVAFYSLACSMADRLLLPTVIFSNATGTTIYAQYGRDKSRLPELTNSAVRYLALMAIPIHVVFSALATPVLLLLYGRQYAGAATVVMLAPLLCIAKAFAGPALDLLQSAERQTSVIAATILAGIVDAGVTWWLVRTKGAVGACIGSGAAQVTACAILWLVAIRLYHVKLPWLAMGKIASMSVVAGGTAYLIAARMAPLSGVLCGGTVALIEIAAGFFFLRLFEPQDRNRFNLLTDKLPQTIGGPARMIFSKLVRIVPLNANPVGVK